jgi:hypothetical protein
MKTCIPYITLGRAVFGLSGQNLNVRLSPLSLASYIASQLAAQDKHSLRSALRALLPPLSCLPSFLTPPCLPPSRDDFAAEEFHQCLVHRDRLEFGHRMTCSLDRKEREIVLGSELAPSVVLNDVAGRDEVRRGI